MLRLEKPTLQTFDSEGKEEDFEIDSSKFQTLTPVTVSDDSRFNKQQDQKVTLKVPDLPKPIDRKDLTVTSFPDRKKSSSSKKIIFDKLGETDAFLVLPVGIKNNPVFADFIGRLQSSLKGFTNGKAYACNRGCNLELKGAYSLSGFKDQYEKFLNSYIVSLGQAKGNSDFLSKIKNYKIVAGNPSTMQGETVVKFNKAETANDIMKQSKPKSESSQIGKYVLLGILGIVLIR